MMNEAFDYIIVGAGSSGCVLANRLSADPACRVCLIEAGPSDREPMTRWKSYTPTGNPFVLRDSRLNWKYSFSGNESSKNREIPCPRGKLLGGTSAVNGMIYMRGDPSDYDAWQDMGNDGWSYDDVLPVFKQHENRERGANQYHGVGGELNVTRLRKLHSSSEAFLQAGAELQFRANDDFNSDTLEGLGPYDLTQKGGERWSSARAFLHPVMHRSNLTVLTGALATRIELTEGRATGLTIVQNGEVRMLPARREIVLSGGTINSPQLLLLSGIGPAAHLSDLNIEVRHELSGVGRNLQDHPAVAVTMLDPTRSAYALNARMLPFLGWNVARYLLSRQGMLASNVVEAGGFVRTRPDVAVPDIQLVFMPALKDLSKPIPDRHGFIVSAVLLRPRSRGFLELASIDPAQKPVLQPNFLEHDEDVDALREGLRIIRRIVSAPAFSRFRGAELQPGAAVQDTADLNDYVHNTVSTIYHPVGTCRMGPVGDREAVVDTRLKVHGLEGLRIADCSIMPTIVSGNTNAPAMMIGERCAAFMKAA